VAAIVQIDERERERDETTMFSGQFVAPAETDIPRLRRYGYEPMRKSKEH
jgi:hypothetical protein